MIMIKMSIIMIMVIVVMVMVMVVQSLGHPILGWWIPHHKVLPMIMTRMSIMMMMVMVMVMVMVVMVMVMVVQSLGQVMVMVIVVMVIVVQSLCHRILAWWRPHHKVVPMTKIAIMVIMVMVIRSSGHWLGRPDHEVVCISLPYIFFSCAFTS